MADAAQTTGMPTEKYDDESHASLLPEIVDIAPHVRTPIMIATT
jgi:hypothetical protein